MKNVSHKNKWNAGIVQLQVEPPPTPIITSKHDDKLEKDFVKMKLHRDTPSDKSDIYEIKMALFGNGKMEEFGCLFPTST